MLKITQIVWCNPNEPVIYLWHLGGVLNLVFILNPCKTIMKWEKMLISCHFLFIREKQKLAQVIFGIMSELDYLTKRPDLTGSFARAVKENEQKQLDRKASRKSYFTSDFSIEGDERKDDSSGKTGRNFVDIGVLAQKDTKDVEMQTHKDPVKQRG